MSWARFAGTRGATASLVGVAVLLAVALGADLLAADLPLAASVDGQLYIFPCVTRPAALALDDQRTLGRRASWMVGTPIPFGPLASRPGGELLRLAPPSSVHLLGTDDRGRDVAARLVHGTRTALLVGAIAVAVALLLGLAVGVLCALGRRTDLVLGRVIDVALAFPVMFLLLALQAAIVVPSVVEVALVIALVRWPDVARLVRVEARRAAASLHVEAARAVGAGGLRIALHHLLPLALGPALVAAGFGVAQSVLLETGLAFLGCGVPPPTATWGELLVQARASGLELRLLLPPLLLIAATVLLLQRVAEGVERALDPARE